VRSQELLWLWDGDSLRTREGERPPLEAGKTGVGQQTKKTQCAYSELQTDCVN
jgi:hypothetical protein